MGKYLIINADDFGYSFGINKGILEAITNGVVTSTSVMVDAIAAHEAKELNGLPGISVGLHLELADLNNVADELQRQIDKFKAIVGKFPDHIDTHKRRPTDDRTRSVLEPFSIRHAIPV